jgi:hypothetical protein
MIILLPLLARLPIRPRAIAGRALAGAGVLGVLAGVIAAPGIVVLAAIVAVMGGVLLFSVRWSRRRPDAGPRGGGAATTRSPGAGPRGRAGTRGGLSGR